MRIRLLAALALGLALPACTQAPDAKTAPKDAKAPDAPKTPNAKAPDAPKPPDVKTPEPERPLPPT